MRPRSGLDLVRSKALDERAGRRRVSVEGMSSGVSWAPSRHPLAHASSCQAACQGRNQVCQSCCEVLSGRHLAKCLTNVPAAPCAVGSPRKAAPPCSVSLIPVGQRFPEAAPTARFGREGPSGEQERPPCILLSRRAGSWNSAAQGLATCGQSLGW